MARDTNGNDKTFTVTANKAKVVTSYSPRLGIDVGQSPSLVNLFLFAFDDNASLPPSKAMFKKDVFSCAMNTHHFH